MRRHSGFTLIELMITVAVMLVLSVIAYSSYLKYTIRGNRSAAESYLMDLAEREQQYLIDNRGYFSSNTSIAAIDSVPSNVSAQYQVTVALPTTVPPTFKITAAPLTGSLQAKYNDPSLTIDNTGAKAPSSIWQ